MRKYGLAWLLIAGGLTAFQLWSASSVFLEQKRKWQTRQEVERIAASTLRFYMGRRPPTGNAFWKELGREPLKDSWGSALYLEPVGKTHFRWRSAGPDRMLSTEDDIFADIPNTEGKVIIPPADDDSTPPARDAI
jgi:hypothetical protein